MSPGMVKGRCTFRLVPRVASVVSCRPASGVEAGDADRGDFGERGTRPGSERRLFQGDHDAIASVATIVAFHTHPEDQGLRAGGTLARLAAEGNRVIIVVACDGVMGLRPALEVRPGWTCCGPARRARAATRAGTWGMPIARTGRSWFPTRPP